EEARFAEQRAEDAGSAVRRADLPHDQGRAVVHPVDGTVGLPHRRGESAAQGGLGDLTTIEAALRGRTGLQGKLVRGPDRARIEFVRRLQDRYAPDLLVVGDGPVERGGAPVALDAGVHYQA